jgi:hypothetical protein
MPDLLLKDSPIDAVAITEEIPRTLVPRKRLNHLLGSLLGCWVLGDVKMHHMAALVGEEHEHEEHAERHSWYGEEIKFY